MIVSVVSPHTVMYVDAATSVGAAGKKPRDSAAGLPFIRTVITVSEEEERGTELARHWMGSRVGHYSMIH